jgi:hypothetical protein
VEGRKESAFISWLRGWSARESISKKVYRGRGLLVGLVSAFVFFNYYNEVNRDVVVDYLEQSDMGPALANFCVERIEAEFMSQLTGTGGADIQALLPLIETVWAGILILLSLWVVIGVVTAFHLVTGAILPLWKNPEELRKLWLELGGFDASIAPTSPEH